MYYIQLIIHTYIHSTFWSTIMSSNRILIIEGQEILATSYKLALELEGFDTIITSDGYTALQKVQSYRPAIIILDISNQDINGWEILKLLHVKEDIEQIPVIVTSELPELRQKIKALQEGAEDYITKPVKLDYLVQRIKTILKDKTTKRLKCQEIKIE